MRMLFVTGSLGHGGAQRVIAVISGQLAEFGHEVSVIVYRRFANEYPVNKKVNIYSLADSQEEYDHISGPKRVLMLRKLLKEIRPNVAVGFLEGGYGLYLASIGENFPKIASARINPIVILEEKGSRGLINRMWFRHADAVVMQTQSQIELLPRNCKWKNCTVIPNPVSETALNASGHNYDRPFNRIIMVGRLEDQKDHLMAVRAMKDVNKKLPGLKLDIYGEGYNLQLIEKEIKAMKLENTISLKGWTQDVVKEYAQSDLYIMTSRYEGMPNSLMEAMACGMVCVSTDCETGPRELIEDGRNGFLVPVEDSNALSETIIKIAGMTQQDRKDIGDAAKKTMQENYSSWIIGKKWEELLIGLDRKQK